MVHQALMKNKTRTTSNSASKSVLQAGHVDHHWWSLETMDKELGPLKAESWRNSKLLKSRPCGLTGSTEDHLLEYKIPVAWDRMSLNDLKTFSVEVTGEADSQDIGLQNDIEGASSSSLSYAGAANTGQAKATAEAAIVVKTEPMTVEETDLNYFMANKKELVREFQDHETDMKELLGKLAGVKYAEGLVKDMEEGLKRIAKTIHVLQKAVESPPTDASKVSLLMKGLRKMRAMKVKFEGPAKGFGATIESRKRRKVR